MSYPKKSSTSPNYDPNVNATDTLQNMKDVKKYNIFFKEFLKNNNEIENPAKK